MLRRVVIFAIVVIAVGLGGFAVFAYRPAIAPIITPTATTFSPDLIARGEVLAGAGYCGECHTVKGAKPNSGGYAIRTDFGTIFSTNITPDPETGIGTWSEAAFARAMREGVSRDGSHLFPAFPYDHFTKLTDSDIHALYAYFMTREPVLARAPANTLPFPLNIRALQVGWKLLYFKPGRFQADTHRSAEWNEGAYLAEGISHCGACHTPRNALGAEEHDSRYAGAEIDHWLAPPLTRANPSPLPWDVPDLVAYLRTGVSYLHGTAVGPMSAVVHDGLIKLPDSDIQALASYFADIDEAAVREMSSHAVLQNTLSREQIDRTRMRMYDPQARLYVSACASCHYNSGTAPDPLRPDLALNSALGLSEPNNLIRIMLEGVNAPDGAPGVVMPAFASGFSNADIAQIAAYLRTTRTELPPWQDLEDKVAALRLAGGSPQ